MAPLDAELFRGAEGQIAQIDLLKCQVNNFQADVTNSLAQFGWDKKTLVATVGLALAADGSSVTSGRLVVKGKLEEKGYRCQANHIWPDADESVSLVIRVPRAEIFEFSEGGLFSDIVPSSDVHHSYFTTQDGKAPAPILPADLSEWDVGDFCVRMLCHLSRASTDKKKAVLKWTVVLYPMGKNELLQTWEGAQSPAWPGLRLGEGELHLWPPPTTPWGCPAVPMLATGRAATGSPVTPPTADIRAAIAAIMGKAVVPDIVKSGAVALKKWKRLASNPEELVAKNPSTTWAAVEETNTADRG